MGKEDFPLQHETFADESVDTRLIEYQKSVAEAVQDFVFLARLHTTTADLDLLMMAGATNELITVVLNAYDAGVDRKNLQTVIADGIQQGKPQTTINTQPFYDATYGQAVYQEAEEFWAKRYDPDASDE